MKTEVREEEASESGEGIGHSSDNDGDYPPWLEVFIDHFCCCFVRRPLRDPYEFKNDRKEYRALCGAVHVQQMAIIFVVVKAALLTLFIISVNLMDTSTLVSVVCVFFYLVVMASYGFLLGGMSLKNYAYMIPYFFVSFISILVAVIHYFVDMLDSANTKDTLETHQLIGFATQTVAIALEVYSLAVVWRVFQYVCDYSMELEIRTKEEYKQILLYDDIVVT